MQRQDDTYGDPSRSTRAQGHEQIATSCCGPRAALNARVRRSGPVRPFARLSAQPDANRSRAVTRAPAQFAGHFQRAIGPWTRTPSFVRRDAATGSVRGLALRPPPTRRAEMFPDWSGPSPSHSSRGRSSSGSPFPKFDAGHWSLLWTGFARGRNVALPWHLVRRGDLDRSLRRMVRGSAALGASCRSGSTSSGRTAA